MATEKQETLAKKISESLGTGQSKGKLVREAKYSKSVSKTPSRVIESKGVQQELGKYGLTEELVKSSLVEDIEMKPQNRVGELRLGAEILGLKSDNPSGDRTLNWYQIIYGNREPTEQGVEVIKSLQDNKQEREASNISKKPRAKRIQSGESPEKHNPKVTPAWIYD